MSRVADAVGVGVICANLPHMIDVHLIFALRVTVSEPIGNDFKQFKNFKLKAMARI